ncbi:hypothetical protein SLEP1_g33117 [Rubroshorea leprosula]|uniref:Bulb-type lectin domain-containing protein n=1 Tax=Rubroshorea leprosula TaxID=152421 RepID=A0AAV5KFM8_9ROSI|nr:hypothetical protein SLEP1_g33117 [Rubroshorea leprosula]
MVVGGRRNTVCFLATFLSLFLISLLLTNVEAFGYPSTAMPSVSWTNIVPNNFSFWESAWVRPILVNGSFVCDFHCKFEGTPRLFAISIFQPKLDSNFKFSTQMVWSANRNKPIGLGAQLQFSQEGDLTLMIMTLCFCGVDTTVVYYQYLGSQKIGQTGQFYAEVGRIKLGGS